MENTQKTKHNLNHSKVYPNYHFWQTSKGKVYLHSNAVVKEGDVLLKDGVQRYEVSQILRDKPSIPELIEERESRDIVEGTRWYEMIVNKLN